MKRKRKSAETRQNKSSTTFDHSVGWGEGQHRGLQELIAYWEGEIRSAWQRLTTGEH